MSDTRQPFEWVEIDQDFCTRSYGVAPCAASLVSGGTECYNTRSTCQDPTNYDVGTLTLRFCKNQAFLPNDGNYYMPLLVSVSVSAGSINPVGASSTSSALGTRGGLSVRFQDAPHTDRYVDPYIANRVSRDAGYIATERGTFWSKWRARNQYYIGRVIRYKSGFIDATGAVVDVVTRTYFITGFDGPDASGAVGMTAKDILSQFANDKAKVPAASNGKLLADLTNVATTLTLDPVGISSEYPASGAIRVGSEIMTYTKGSGDTLNLTRAQYGSALGTGKAGDVVQLCAVYTAQAPATILADLLTTYAGIPAGYLDTAQWNQEQTDYLPRLYGTVISEPTGVQEIIAEMCEQMYFYLIWDEREAKLKLRAIRPAQDDTIYSLSDFGNFQADSVTLRDLNDQLVTQVWVYYGLINYAASAKEEKNYAVREIIATDEGLPEKNDFEKIKKIYCRWIPSTNGAAAVDLGEKMIARYGAAPRQVAFTLAGKDSDIWIGDFLQVSHRLSVDATGAPRPLNIQVMSAQETRAGTEFRYVGQEFVFEAPVDPNDRLIVIAADQLNVNLRTLHDSIYSAPTGTEVVNVIIRGGVIIGGSSTAGRDSYTGEYDWFFATSGGVATGTLHALVRREVSSPTFLARGTTIAVGDLTGNLGRLVSLLTPGSFMYELKNDMWQVPCPVSFDTGTWPSGVTINITVEAGAYIVGMGGYSSSHTGRGGGSETVVSGIAGLQLGSDGGHAVRVRHPVSINNLGVIGGGGAGGFAGLANGSLNFGSLSSSYYLPNASGGGAGRVSNTVVTNAAVDPLMVYARIAAAGSLTSGGVGSVFRVGNPVQFSSQAGRGAALGASADQATANDPGLSTYMLRRFACGRAGYAVSEGASLITWTNKGDVRGPEVA